MKGWSQPYGPDVSCRAGEDVMQIARFLKLPNPREAAAYAVWALLIAALCLGFDWYASLLSQMSMWLEELGAPWVLLFLFIWGVPFTLLCAAGYLIFVLGGRVFRPFFSTVIAAVVFFITVDEPVTLIADYLALWFQAFRSLL